MKCMACGIEKDPNVKEVYPYAEEEGIVEDPIEPFWDLDCEPTDYDVEIPEEDRKWRKVTVCHECLHKLQADLWISAHCWRLLNPVIPFRELPLLGS